MREFHMKKLRCSNCGYEFVPNTELNSPNENLISDYNCPVCQFGPVAISAASPQKTMSATDLENQLKTLLSKARTGGLTSDVIVDVLRSELEFEAELGQGRRLLVQLIDLGFHDVDTAPSPIRNSRQTPQNHGSL